ncbi:MAG: radical SAM protein, partial [Syntrophales bacterium LBB04]|nr:radical SAM protein [Syntrophales bacterium LBB04]
MVFRRSFLKSSFFLSSACLESTLLAEKLETLLRNSPRARFWVSADSADGNCQSCHENTPPGEAGTYAHRKGYVKCLLCAQNCVLAPGERGKCRARLNVNGELRSLVYGRPITQHLDPIEKKPFYHFLPGSMAYSLATSGCPLRCRFCQNWEISQASPEDYESPRIQPVKIAEACLGKQAPILAFTYNEPTVFTEYLLEIAQAASRLGIYSVMISCGFMNPLPLRELCQNLQAIKIDLKGFSPEFYQNICSANLAPGLRSDPQN